MIYTHKKNGFTLVELLVAIGIVLIMAGVSLPLINSMRKTYNTTENAETMIAAALRNARAIAMRERKYAGVRFQKAWDNNNDPSTMSQYMIFIVKEGRINYEFHAVKGRAPIKLPDSITLTDMRLGSTSTDDDPLRTDIDIKFPEQLRDITTFSVVYSPSGQLSVIPVHTRNKDGESENQANAGNTFDRIFSGSQRVIAGDAMFPQDENIGLGIDQEDSRLMFYIYDRNLFKTINTESRWTDFFQNTENTTQLYINEYTGELMK